MGKLIVFAIAFFILPIANAVCVVPGENMELKESAAFCYGAYSIESGIQVSNDNIVIDCNSSALIGNGIGYGVLLRNKNNVIVKNCNISNYEVGVYLDKSNNSVIKNNYLIKNKFGIALFNSFDNDINNNTFFDNINSNQVIYLPTPAAQQTEIENPEVKQSDAWQIIKEVISIKKPFLSEKEILSEVDLTLAKYFNTTQENLEISRTIFYNESDKSTKIMLRLRPKKVLLNVSIYEKIPKCVSSYVSQILFETGGYEIVQNDPLILWTFSRLDSEKEVSYKVFRKIDEECKKLLVAFGIATGFEDFEKKGKNERKLSYFISVLVIFMVVVVILAAYLFFKKNKHN